MNTEENRTMRKHIAFIAGLIFGATVAALVALLYAPQPGAELRECIREWSLDNLPWMEKQEWITCN